MLGGLSGWHLLIILAVILLIFGAPKLPGLAKSIGQSMRIFKSEVDEMKKDGKSTAGPADTATAATTPTEAIPPAAAVPPTAEPPAASPSPATPSSETHTKP